MAGGGDGKYMINSDNEVATVVMTPVGMKMNVGMPTARDWHRQP